MRAHFNVHRTCTVLRITVLRMIIDHITGNVGAFHTVQIKYTTRSWVYDMGLHSVCWEW